MNQSPVTSHQSTVEEPTTMRLYRPLEDYGKAHQQAFHDLARAVAGNDEVAMKEAFDAIMYFEQMQREAAQKVRSHLLEKARSRDV